MPTETIETNPARVALEKVRADLAVAVGATAANAQVVDRGDVVGVITASGKVRTRNGASADGSEVAAGIADEGSDGVGDTPIRILIGGYLDEAQINGLDASAKTELGGVSVVGGIFKF